MNFFSKILLLIIICYPDIRYKIRSLGYLWKMYTIFKGFIIFNINQFFVIKQYSKKIIYISQIVKVFKKKYLGSDFGNFFYEKKYKL